MNEPATIDAILRNTKTIAIVGLSDSPYRASYGVARYLQQSGYRVLPVNPTIASALGETAYPTLDAAQVAAADQKLTINVVNVFRAPAYIPEIVKDVLRLKIPALWLQLGVVHDEAACWAEAAGVQVIMDHCIMVEHAHMRRE